MAKVTATSFDLSKAGDTNPLLGLKVEDVEYEISTAGAITKRAGGAVSAAEQESVLKAAKKAAEEFVGKKQTIAGQEKAVDAVRKFVEAGHTANPTLFETVKKTVDAAKEVEVAAAALPTDRLANAAEVKKLRLALAKDKNAINVINHGALGQIEQKFDRAGVETAVVDFEKVKKAADESRTAFEKFETAVAEGKVTEKTLRDELLKTTDMKDMLTTEMKDKLRTGGTGYSATKAIPNVDTIITTLENDIATHNGIIATRFQAVQTAKAGVENATRLNKADAEKALDRAIKDYNNYKGDHSQFVRHMDEHLAGNFTPEQISEVSKIKGMESVASLGVKTEAAAAKSGGWVSRTFMKSSEEIAALGEKANFLKKLNGKGKTALIAGIAAVTWGVVAATSTKGEKEQKVIENRSTEPSMAR